MHTEEKAHKRMRGSACNKSDYGGRNAADEGQKLAGNIGKQKGTPHRWSRRCGAAAQRLTS